MNFIFATPLTKGVAIWYTCNKRGVNMNWAFIGVGIYYLCLGKDWIGVGVVFMCIGIMFN